MPDSSKFYVVWVGRTPGVYTSWDDCKNEIHKFKNPRYKSFPNLESAEKAFQDGIQPTKNKGGKYYVVWKGKNPGVYKEWKDAEIQITDFKNSKYKSFPNEVDARKAFKDGPDKYLKVSTEPTVKTSPIPNSICVDAACSANPGPVEYRGVYSSSKKIIFSIGPLLDGTNNIGEFLAIVHALALCKKHYWKEVIYSDSTTAISWVKNKKANTQLERTEKNKTVFDLIERAEKWLDENKYENPVHKWLTKDWGEIPADYNRKK